MSEPVKRSALAGTWYAADAEPLRRQVDALLDTVEGGALPQRVAGLIVPHAGYVYSGRAAAAGYARLRGVGYRRALILAPSHYAAFRGAAVLDVAYFETPLGAGAGRRWRRWRPCPGPRCVASTPRRFATSTRWRSSCRSCNACCPACRWCPCCWDPSMGRTTRASRTGLGTVVDAETLVIVSSDFVHYGSRFAYEPFPAHDAEQVRGALRRLDMGAIDLVCRGDAAGFGAYVAATGATICGAVPIGVFLTRTPDARRAGCSSTTRRWT